MPCNTEVDTGMVKQRIDNETGMYRCSDGDVIKTQACKEAEITEQKVRQTATQKY